MDPLKRLKRGEKAAREGRYEDALADFIWFHEHSLEHAPAYYGVRLSFALASWLELAEAYPPARSALQNIRDRKTDVLNSGAGDRDLFHDVESINGKLGELDATRDLFMHIESLRPALAQECSDLAREALIAAGEFATARRYISDPEATIRQFATRLNSDIANLPKIKPARAPVKEAYTWIYANAVREILDVLRGTEETDEAERLKELSIASVEDPTVRAAVAAQLG